MTTKGYNERSLKQVSVEFVVLNAMDKPVYLIDQKTKVLHRAIYSSTPLTLMVSVGDASETQYLGATDSLFMTSEDFSQVLDRLLH